VEAPCVPSWWTTTVVPPPARSCWLQSLADLDGHELPRETVAGSVARLDRRLAAHRVGVPDAAAGARELVRVVEAELHHTGRARSDVVRDLDLVRERRARLGVGRRGRSGRAGRVVVQVLGRELLDAVGRDVHLAVRAHVVEGAARGVVLEGQPDVLRVVAGVLVRQRDRLRLAREQLVEREVHAVRTRAAAGGDLDGADGAGDGAAVGVAEERARRDGTDDRGGDRDTDQSEDRLAAVVAELTCETHLESSQIRGVTVARRLRCTVPRKWTQ
jgi:hypothetical protein